MNILVLRGVTGKGKNRIREHGEEWKSLEHSSPLRPNEKLVVSLKTGDTRWLTEDFEVINEHICK